MLRLLRLRVSMSPPAHDFGGGLTPPITKPVPVFGASLNRGFLAISSRNFSRTVCLIVGCDGISGGVRLSFSFICEPYLIVRAFTWIPLENAPSRKCCTSL